MNSTNPNSTLTSSTSNQHLRLALQALPYAPDPESSSASPQKKKGSKKDKDRLKEKQRRGHVEHFVPAIWVPDSKAEACMRCGGVFGWRRRRHHCRLCGKCVCANCSGKVCTRTCELWPYISHRFLDILYSYTKLCQGIDQTCAGMQCLLRGGLPRFGPRNAGGYGSNNTSSLFQHWDFDRVAIFQIHTLSHFGPSHHSRCSPSSITLRTSRPRQTPESCGRRTPKVWS